MIIFLGILGYVLFGCLIGLGTFCLIRYLFTPDDEFDKAATIMALILWPIAIAIWIIYFTCRVFYKYIVCPCDSLLNMLDEHIQEAKLSTDSKLDKLIAEIAKLEPSLKEEMNNLKGRIR